MKVYLVGPWAPGPIGSPGLMFPVEEIPETIGNYRIVEQLAPVGPAEVFLARSEGPLGFARECELKLLPDTSEGNAEFAEELAREAAICAKMNNPTVVRLFDFFEHRGKLVLVLEHVEGMSLVELMAWLEAKGEKLSDAAALYIGSKIAGALADAHAATDEQGKPTPIVHRNLTPENVIIARDGEVRLTGFGVGKIVGRTPDTAIGRIKGTPGFMAPEQARGEPVTTKADVYGLGVLMWSLFTWKRPPTDGTWPRKVSNLRTDLPREVAAVVDAALDPFPGTRKITAHEIERWITKSTPAHKGKNELKDRVVSLRAELGAKDDAPPSLRGPSSQKGGAEAASKPPSHKNPFDGVRFGPPGAEEPTRPAAKRAPAARPHEKTPAASVVADLPPPPPLAAEPRPVTLPGIAPNGAPTLPDDAPPVEPEIPKPSIAPAAGPILERVRTALPKSSLIMAAPTAEEMARATAAMARGELPDLAGRPAVIDPPAHVDPPPAPTFGVPPFIPPTFGAPPPPVAAPTPPPQAPPARSAMSPVITVLLSSLTAAFVVAVAFYFIARKSGGDPPPARAASASATASAAPAPPAASASAAATAAPVIPASATPSAAPAAGPDPADLPYGYGYLQVSSPANANVYLSGKLAGPVNQPLKVRCGRFFIRLAAPGEGRFPEWVSAGETFVIACQQMNRMEMAPKP